MKRCKNSILMILFFISWLPFSIVHSQIILENASFEDIPSDATTPQEWFPCKDMTTPDILPGFWGVYNEPSNGETYVGIITRENGTFESFGQKLSDPVEKGTCYKTQIDLAHSKIYSGYNKPIHLRIYLGSTKCAKSQLIYQSPIIKHGHWKTYSIEFEPNDQYDYLLIEAYISEKPINHKGNILIDNLRPIMYCGNV